MTPTFLDKLMQLHESLELLYEVDYYAARLFTRDCMILAAEAHGETVIDALQNLMVLLSNSNIKSVTQLRLIKETLR